MTEKEIIHELNDIINYSQVSSFEHVIKSLNDLKDKIAKVKEITCLDNQITCKFNKENLCKRINFCKFKSQN